MKVKIEYIILGAIILALSLYLFQRNTNKVNYQLPSLPGISIKDISKIEISGPDESIALNKKDSKWYIGTDEYLADSKKAQDMLDVIGKLTLTALVSESKKYSRYNLSNDKKIHVKAWIGDKIKREFEIGKAAGSYQHTFVKLSEDHRVYHAIGNFRGKFDQAVENIRDKVVLSFEKADIYEIKITKEEKSLVFKREESPVVVKPGENNDKPVPPSKETEQVWKRSDGENADQSSLNSLLATLSHLRCDRYISDKRKEDFTDPLHTVLLTGTQKYTLSIFPETEKGNEKYPALSSENDYPFLLTKLQVENIMKKSGWIDKKVDKS